MPEWRGLGVQPGHGVQPTNLRDPLVVAAETPECDLDHAKGLIADLKGQTVYSARESTRCP